MIERRIYLIRGQKVMLDRDLAELYQVETRTLNQAVRRNRDRFPEDFMFQLNKEESSALRSQSVTLERGRGRYPKYSPFAFTEHGVAMLSSVLRTSRAVQMNILIIRAFVQLREMLVTHKELAARMAELEQEQQEQRQLIAEVFEHIQKLLDPVKKTKRPIGFRTPGK